SGESGACLLQCSDGRSAPFTSFDSFARRQLCARTTRHAGPAIQARVSQNTDGEEPRCSTQRVGIAAPHAAVDGLRGVNGGAGLRGGTGTDGISGGTARPAEFPDGVPLARAMNPWAIPEAST